MLVAQGEDQTLYTSTFFKRVAVSKDSQPISPQQLEQVSAALEHLLGYDPKYYDNESDKVLWERKRKLIDALWPLRGKRLERSSLPLVTSLLLGFAAITAGFFPASKFQTVLICSIGILIAHYLEYSDQARFVAARRHLEAIDKVLAHRGLPLGCDSNQLFDFLAKEPS